jgi:hypothetical protein
MKRFCSMDENPVSGTFMLVCMQTGAEINTRTGYTQDDLARAKSAKLLLHFRFCHQTHLFKFSDARLKAIDIENRSPAPTG